MVATVLMHVVTAVVTAGGCAVAGYRVHKRAVSGGGSQVRGQKVSLSRFIMRSVVKVVPWQAPGLPLRGLATGSATRRGVSWGLITASIKEDGRCPLIRAFSCAVGGRLLLLAASRAD